MPAIKRVHKERHIYAIKRIPVSGAVAELAVAGAIGAVQAVHEDTVKNAFCAIRPPGVQGNDARLVVR